MDDTFIYILNDDKQNNLLKFKIIDQKFWTLFFEPTNEG